MLIFCNYDFRFGIYDFTHEMKKITFLISVLISLSPFCKAQTSLKSFLSAEIVRYDTVVEQNKFFNFSIQFSTVIDTALIPKKIILTEDTQWGNMKYELIYLGDSSKLDYGLHLGGLDDDYYSKELIALKKAIPITLDLRLPDILISTPGNYKIRFSSIKSPRAGVAFPDYWETPWVYFSQKK